MPEGVCNCEVSGASLRPLLPDGSFSLVILALTVAREGVGDASLPARAAAQWSRRIALRSLLATAVSGVSPLNLPWGMNCVEPGKSVADEGSGAVAEDGPGAVTGKGV
jgi:hypothetical protein